MYTFRISQLFQNLATLFFITLFFPLLGHAQTEQDNSEIAVYTGPINQEKVDAFLKNQANKHVVGLRINSNGGLVLPAIQLGRWVRTNNMTVSVHNICMSSCANYVFSAGSKKIIEQGAIVVWHGSTEQKDIREGQKQFEMLDKNLSSIPADNEERSKLEAKRLRYLLIEKQRQAQSDWFHELGLDEYFFRIGQEPVPLADAWTTTVAVMNKYGIQQVSAPTNYGTPEYLHTNPIVLMAFKNKLGSFDLDSEGNVVPLKQASEQEKRTSGQ